MLMMSSVGVRIAPDKFVVQMKSTLSGPDAALLNDKPEISKLMIESWSQAFRSGIAGAYHDSVLYKRPWGFLLEEIGMEVHLWHGEQDNNVPISIARHVAGLIPNCRATFFKDEGHLTLIHNRSQEIPETLVTRR